MIIREQPRRFNQIARFFHRPGRRGIIFACLMITLSGVLSPAAPNAVEAAESQTSIQRMTKNIPILSPYWSPTVRQWSVQIEKVAKSVGIDPDFVAAIIAAESDGISTSVSRVGAVGLMGVMPSGPGMEWRPTSEQLTDPGMNLRWGVAIMTDIIRQSGGDLSAALAAYAGGWREANRLVPKRYAASVLDEYSRAVLMRNGISPEIASSWTLALEMTHGNVPPDPLWVLGKQPVSGLHTYTEHILYQYIDDRGRLTRLKVFVVPVALQVAELESAVFGASDAIDPRLAVRIGLVSAKELKAVGRSPRVLVACLPSLNRLRGKQSTRWFAPSSCPAWHR